MPEKTKIQNKKWCSGFNFTPFDMFGSPVEFKINGQSNYKTFIGFLWTIVMICLMVAATVYYLLIFLDKTNVTLTGQIVQDTVFPKMDFKEKGLFITILFQQGDKFLRPSEVTSYFDIEAG